MRLYWDDGVLRFYDPLTGEFLLDHEESENARIIEREGRLAEREARIAERNARLAAEAENARLREASQLAEAEVSRLRRLLNRFRGGE